MIDYYLPTKRRRENLRHNYLWPIIDEAAAHFKCEGHASRYVRHCLTCIAHFGNWLEKEGVDLKSVNRGHARDFIRQYVYPFSRGRTCRVSIEREVALGVRHAMRLIEQRYPLELDAIQLEVAAYVDYLRNDRGFQEGSIEHHKLAMEAFLRQFVRNEAVHMVVGKLSAKEVHDYIEQLPVTRTNSKRKGVCAALRGYFRFLALKGLNVGYLSGAVPSVACSRPALSPKIMSSDDIHILLDSIDISRPVGKRTRAVILALSDLGMRIGDVSRLKLDDIDWRNGTIRVENRKRATPYRLPLPKRLGEALVDYIRNGRPPSKAREIFLSHGRNKPAGKPASFAALKNEMKKQWITSGLYGKYSGTHILRHSTATRLKQEGFPLKSIADVLGHSSIETTALYAQVDVPALRTVAQSWPEGRP